MVQFFTAINSARSELGDTYAGSYSYSDADMLRYAAEGVREAWRMRPSFKYSVTTGALYDPDAVLPVAGVDSADMIPLPDEVCHAIAYYIVYRCLSRDVTDQGNERAAVAAKTVFDQAIAG